MNGHGDNIDDVARVTARNAEILECKRRIAELEASRRRESLLASLDLDPLGTWEKLTEEEKHDRDFVIKAISNGGVYSNNQWRTTYAVAGGEDLPEQFHEDRDAVLAFVARDHFRGVFKYDIFNVPVSLRDDKEVMLAVCRKNASALELASPRLQDDRDVVLATFGGPEHHDATLGGPDDLWALEHASQRFRSDRDLILRLVQCTSRCFFGWLKHTQLGPEDAKQVALAVLNRVSELKSSGHSCDSSEIVRYFSETLRDDRDVMSRYVEDHWQNLPYCSDRLKISEEFVSHAVSRNVNVLMYCPEAAKEKVLLKRDSSDVINDLEDGILLFESLPNKMKTDPVILLAALKGGSICFKDLPDDMQREKSVVLALPEGSNESNKYSYYDHLPVELQYDEELCLEIIKKKYRWPTTILDLVKSLYRSREAIIVAIKFFPGRYDASGRDLSYIIQRCSFRDDEEVMLLACENSINCLQHADERLKSDRGFILAVLSGPWGSAAFRYLSRDFLINNIDVVQKAIELCGDGDNSISDMIMRQDDVLAPHLWQNRSIVLACLKKGWPILQKLDRDSPLLDDDELVRLAVENRGVTELEYASSSLKDSREFALSVVKINGRSLSYVDAAFRRDDEIVTEAIANTGRTILDCFRSEDDFDYLVSLASRVRARLELHRSFLNNFLRGISVSRPHVAPAKRCRLPILDRGTETSTTFKKLISEYVGVPVKLELRLLRTASENLRKLCY